MPESRASSVVVSTITIVPNHSDAYLLRVGKDGWIYEAPILAWRIEWFTEKRDPQCNWVLREWSFATPISVEELASNERECVVARGQWTIQEDRAFETKDEAIQYCLKALNPTTAAG